ncbi:MAG TPA: CRISPR-associated protein Cas4 [Prevotella sp.]|jgi:CRISPR-associated exonuclease Cas4|nr:CRISPR-associated protein Cas4 [Prevotella sp.]
MTVTGTIFNYFMVCRRKLWLFAHGITMEHESELVYEGKLIHENSYPERNPNYEEIELDGIKVDFYDARHHVIHEIKKSDKLEAAGRWQLKYYLYVFEMHGVKDIKGVLEFPKQRKTENVTLTDEDRQKIKDMLADIEKACEEKTCPPLLKKERCKQCSYYEFCYTNEIELS